ncbi:pseudouridine synthase [Testicularia cyperi]|uniref:tRNA pseudouridine(55) synthase n=1 Tax=Testicularia cyperi TaxID=1882483 RepID=A0A317Y127_9BASI|nr:pseudouridine synthase [Testicularia cyperi]
MTTNDTLPEPSSPISNQVLDTSTASAEAVVEEQSSAPMAAAASSVGPIRTAARGMSTAVMGSASSASSSKASVSARPLSGLFGINKPSGPTSMSLLDDLKPLFANSSLFADADGRRSKDQSRKRGRFGKGKGGKWAGGVAGAPKLGQGGTLDPLADGVLVIGVGNGTKHLQKYLDCTKEYRCTGLLGSATTSYDSCDPILTRKPYSHVTPSKLGDLLPQFTGDVKQVPPLYSAVRIDGKRLFEYARLNIPLPRPIEPRSVTVHELRLVDWLPADSHSFKEPEQEVPEQDKALVGRVLQMAGRDESQTDTTKADSHSVPPTAAAPAEAAESGEELTAPSGWTRLKTGTETTDNGAEASTGDADKNASTGPPAFVLEMTVSSGTYVRSIVHDLAKAAGSAAHVQTLTRTRQGEWSIDTPASRTGLDDTTNQVIQGNCMDWNVFANAIADMHREKNESDYKAPRDEDGLLPWERELLKVIIPV